MALRLSIIIPFFNVERYISGCLDSVFNQDIPYSEYEVICVNDGSPDHSRDIVLEYMEKYPNLRLIEHEKNKKLGAARNTGRSIAQGDYIWNVDSDDKIVPNCLGEMLQICEENDLDVLEFVPKQFGDDGISELPHPRPSQQVMKGLDYMEKIPAHEISHMATVWRKMIRRDYLDKHSIFSPEINMGEDVPYSFSVLLHAERLLVSPNSYYLYRQNPVSLTGAKWIPKAETLYEKCNLNPRMIYDVAQAVPVSYPRVRKAYSDAAKYSFLRYRDFLPDMSSDSQRAFKKLCRKSVLKDRFIRDLISRKSYAFYLLWIFGLISSPR